MARVKPTEKYKKFENRIDVLGKYIAAQANNMVVKLGPIPVLDPLSGYRKSSLWEPFVVQGSHYPEDAVCGVIYTRPTAMDTQEVNVSIFNSRLESQIQIIRDGHGCRNAQERLIWDLVIAKFENWIETKRTQ